MLLLQRVLARPLAAEDLLATMQPHQALQGELQMTRRGVADAVAMQAVQRLPQLAPPRVHG